MTKGKNRLSIEFSGFEEYAERLEKMDGDLKGTTEKALKKSQEHVTPVIRDAIRKHKNSGGTEEALIDRPGVEWEGNTASIEIGFDILNGGLASVFLMYGTARHAPRNQYGSPKRKDARDIPAMVADKALFESVYGKKIRKETAEIQEKVFADEIAERVGK